MSASFEIRRRDGVVHTVHVDDGDLEAVRAAGPWHVKQGPADKTIYVKRNRVGEGLPSTLLLHRLLLGEPVAEVDHIDGNGLNNCRNNLRTASRSENMANTALYRNNGSGAKGVRWRRDIGRWQARIGVAGDRRHLGYFDTRQEAEAVYARAARGAFGDFANVEGVHAGR